MSDHQPQLPLLTPDMAAQRLGARTGDWLARRAASGAIPSHKIGMDRRFCETCLLAIAAQTYQPRGGTTTPSRDTSADVRRIDGQTEPKPPRRKTPTSGQRYDNQRRPPA